MNVLIDARVGQYAGTGCGVYINSLICALDEIVAPGDNINLLVYSGKKVPHSIEQCRNMEVHHLSEGLEWTPRKGMLDERETTRIIRRLGVDVFHCPSFMRLRTSECKRVVTVLDLYMFSPWHGFGVAKKLWWRHLMANSVASADGIITISDFTGDLLRERFNVPAEKTRTIHLGPGCIRETYPSEPPQAAHGRGKYILFVGTHKPNKNIQCLIEAYGGIGEPLAQEYQLLLIGPRTPGVDDLLGNTELVRAERVQWQDIVSESRLQDIYEKATLFVHPSFVEGFGLPLVEAMRCGLPVIASDIPINHEIAGDAAIYFDPFDSNDLRVKIQEVLSDTELRLSLSRRSLERSRAYSWEDCAKQHYLAYEAVLGG
ncbi:MAG: glycosyltransferase family 4 protein [Candidatus Geothermincolia bacterium]